MNANALYVERRFGGGIGPGFSIVFETVLYKDGIEYDLITGNASLSTPGQYTVHWWVATQSALAKEGLVFSLVTSDGDEFRGNSDNKLGQIEGSAVIAVSAPVTLALRYDGDRSGIFSSVVPVKAAMLIVGNITGAFGELSGNAGLLELTTSNTVVPLDTASEVSSNITFGPANSITIQQTGAYQVIASVIGQVLETNETIGLTVRVNGATRLSQALPTDAGIIMTFYLNSFLELNEGDVLTLQMSASSDLTFFFLPGGSAATLSVLFVGRL